jgi:hypothetical protein
MEHHDGRKPYPGPAWGQDDLGRTAGASFRGSQRSQKRSQRPLGLRQAPPGLDLEPGSGPAIVRGHGVRVETRPNLPQRGEPSPLAFVLGGARLYLPPSYRAARRLTSPIARVRLGFDESKENVR